MTASVPDDTEVPEPSSVRADSTPAELLAQVLPDTESLPEDVRPQVTALLAKLTMEMGAYQWAGPPASILKGYEEVVPGSAREVLDEWRAQSRHRRELERLTVTGANARANRGQWMALGLSIGVEASAVALGFAGHEWLGGVLGGVALGSLVGVFVYGSQGQRGAAKAPPPAPPSPPPTTDVVAHQTES